MFLALLDGTLPETVGAGSTYEARAALADVHGRYRDSDPGLHPAVRALLERTLVREPGRHAPVEVTDRWKWLVYVTDTDDAMGVAQAMPFRCFERLKDARRYAILHTDYSRSTVRGSRTNAKFLQAIETIAECGASGATVEVPNSMWKTVVVLNDLAPLSVDLATA